MEGSLKHDERIRAHERQERENAMKAIAARQNLTRLEDEIEDLQRQLAAEEQDKADVDDELMKLVGPWARKFETELEAIDDQKRMVALAKAITQLL